MPFFKLLLECLFFHEMFKQVRGSFNDYVDTFVYYMHVNLTRAILFCGGGGAGAYSRYSIAKVYRIVRLEFPQRRKQNTNSTLVAFQGMSI